MKKITTLIALLLVGIYVHAQTINATISVNMTGFTVPTAGVHVAGSFNGWNPSANALTDAGNNVWTITLAVTPGSDVEYKFMNGDAWGTEESAPSPCTVGGHNRIFTAGSSDMTIDVVPFNGCPSIIATKTISFGVSMDGQTVGSAGVHVAGNFNGWTPSATGLAFTSGTTYEASSVTILASILSLQYKYLNGDAWGTEETPPSACSNSGHNRVFDISNMATGKVPTYVFGTCNLVTTGVDVKKPFSFTVFPSIASDYIGIKLTSANQNDIKLNIYSVNGALISSENVKRNSSDFEAQISVGGLSQGVYLLEVVNSGSKSVQRFMVK